MDHETLHHYVLGDCLNFVTPFVLYWSVLRFMSHGRLVVERLRKSCEGGKNSNEKEFVNFAVYTGDHILYYQNDPED